MSERKYPILPLSAFDDTINFESMPSPEMRRLRTDLSTQLATNGFATALVVNDRGNASQVVYLMTSEMPSKVYYHANFLRKEDMTEAVGAAAYHAPGNMSLTSRGQPAENVKYLFAK